MAWKSICEAMTSSPLRGAGTSELRSVSTASWAYPSNRSSANALATRAGVCSVSASSSAPQASSRSSTAFASALRSGGWALRSWSAISPLPVGPAIDDGAGGNLPEPHFHEARQLALQPLPHPGGDVLRSRVLDEVVQVRMIDLVEHVLLDRLL